MEVGGMEDEFLPWKYVECPMEVHGNFHRGVLKIQRVWNALLPSQMKEKNEKHASIFDVGDAIRILRCRRYFASTVSQASWYPGGVAGNSSTCVQFGEEWKPHRLDHHCGGSPASNKVDSSCGRYRTRVLAVLFTKVQKQNCYLERRKHPCENVDRLP